MSARRGVSRLFGRLRQPAKPPATLETWQERAIATYDAMNRAFQAPGSALFREHAQTLPTDRRYAYLWPFGQALAATIDMAGLPGASAATLTRAEQLADAFYNEYWEDDHTAPGGTAYPGDRGGEKFYDDNLWIGLDLIALWQATRHDRWRTIAAQIFDFVRDAWDDDESHPCPGGIFWALPMANPTGDRNTVSNAPAAILAVHLYHATGDRDYLDWAQRLIDWVHNTLCDPADGLYWDHLKLSGQIERTKWSYNQGTMIGALTLLGQALRKATLLKQAQELAHAALGHYDTDRLWTHQDPPFNAIFFRNLRILGDALHDHQFYRPALTDYAERAWRHGRLAQSGLHGFGRQKRVELLYQAAAIQLFAHLALFETKHL